MSRSRWICLALAALTAALFWPATHCDFIDLDDQDYVTENIHVQGGLNWETVKWAFCNTKQAAYWAPLTWMSHALACQWFGLKPWGHHLINVLLHAGSTALVFLVFLRLTGATWRCLLLAVLFGWHPLRVESVAWVTERKDVLSAFFWMLTLWAYVNYVEQFKIRSSKSRLWYGAALLFLALGLMSKAMLVTLPCVLLLLDYWPLGRFAAGNAMRLVREKIPFFGLAAVASALTVLAQKQGGAMVTLGSLPLGVRAGNALISYCRYLGKLFWPAKLAAFYPPGHWPLAQMLLAGALLAGLSALFFWGRRRYPFLLMGWLWFIGTLVPVIGLTQAGDQAMADRFTYIPSIGFFVTVVWAGAEWAARLPSVKLLAPALAVALAAATGAQLQYWRDTRTLFSRAMQVTVNNYEAMTLVGAAEENRGRVDEAIGLYRKALACKPNYAEAHFYLGRALEGKGQSAEAMSEYTEALRLRPDLAVAHVMIGLRLAGENKFDEAVTQYQAALKSNPDLAAAQNDWGAALTKQERWQESIGHYEQALRLDPNLARARENLAMAYLRTGRLGEATTEMRDAVKLDPTNMDIRLNLGVALNQQQQWVEAAELLEPLSLSQPTNAILQYQYGLDLEHLGQVSEAMKHYAAALEQNPDLPEALQHSAWIAATDSRPELRNGAQAVQRAARACELTGQSRPSMLLTLAAAYAEAGRFGDALATVGKAEELAGAQGQKGLQTEAGLLRASFKEGRPFRSQ